MMVIAAAAFVIMVMVASAAAFIIKVVAAAIIIFVIFIVHDALNIGKIIGYYINLFAEVECVFFKTFDVLRNGIQNVYDCGNKLILFGILVKTKTISKPLQISYFFGCCRNDTLLRYSCEAPNMPYMMPDASLVYSAVFIGNYI